MHSASSKCFFKTCLLVFSLIIGLAATAQPPIELPETQLPIDPKTLSQPQLQALLEDQNSENGKDINSELYKNNKIDKDSIVGDAIKVGVYSPKNTYGADIFTRASVYDVSELSTPPLDYPIGVGDQIIVSLWNGAELQQSYIVAKDGSIFPRSLGKIYLQGLSFENMRAVIYARFKTVTPAGTNISVSLGQPRSINVNVGGEAKVPGSYTVSAFSNAFNVLARAQGVTQFGNLRSIIIKRNGKQIDEIDVYKYLTTGDFGKHIYLQNNDFIIV